MFVVTGGGSGLGRALAQSLAQRNKQVLVIGRREQALAETASLFPQISYLVADLATSAGRLATMSHLQELSSLEGLVHNAGIIEPIEPLASINEQAWQQILDTNLNAPLFLTQLLLNKLKNGRVLHIGSGAAYFPVKGWAGYCVSKAALSMLTRCWQLESESISFSSVMPGIIDTDMQALIRSASFMDQEKSAFFHDLKREGRLLSVATVASFLTWLLVDLDKETFRVKEWDIYEQNHHQSWLVSPQTVPQLEP